MSLATQGCCASACHCSDKETEPSFGGTVGMEGMQQPLCPPACDFSQERTQADKIWIVLLSGYTRDIELLSRICYLYILFCFVFLIDVN